MGSDSKGAEGGPGPDPLDSIFFLGNGVSRAMGLSKHHPGSNSPLKHSCKNGKWTQSQEAVLWAQRAPPTPAKL